MRLTMKENKILDMSKEFASEIVKVSNILRAKGENAIADQMKRSGTSICANVSEANYAQSTKDLVSKFEIALKEANETNSWLDIIYNNKFISDQTYKLLSNQVIKIKILLIKSIKTIKNNHGLK